MKQMKLNLNKGKRGGRREGAGRKRIHSNGVSHRTRQKVSYRTPLHINWKYKAHIRNKDSLRILKRAILNARKHGLRIVHYSLQSNHVHLIIEAGDNRILTKGMRSITVTMARGLSKGRVQIERYHLHVLRTLNETRNAVLYVCFNKQKHEKRKISVLDEYSSLLHAGSIRNYAQKMRVTLKITNTGEWKGDPCIGFLLQKIT